jgi:hypothetical protein
MPRQERSSRSFSADPEMDWTGVDMGNRKPLRPQRR